MATSTPTRQHCASCGEPIFWLKHARTGKVAPIEANTSPEGNVLTDVAHARYTIATASERRDYPGYLHFNHFARCPQAKTWTRHGSRANTRSTMPARSGPAATPKLTQPADYLPAVEPLTHVRLMPAWQDAEAGNWWLLDLPGVEGQTASFHGFISERHVVELLLNVIRARYTVPPEVAHWIYNPMLEQIDVPTIRALADLIRRVDENGGAA